MLAPLLLPLRAADCLSTQGIFGCLPWGVIQTYITDYLHVQKGLSIEMATTVIMMFGVGCAAGVVAGGAAGQALYNRCGDWLLWSVGACCLCVARDRGGREGRPDRGRYVSRCFPFNSLSIASTTL